MSQTDNPNDTAPKELPAPGKLNSSELRIFVDRRIAYASPLRIWEVSTWRRAELYDQGWDWLNRAYTASDSAAASSWARKSFAENDPLAIPMPVYNEGLPLRQNESARLARPEYTPSVPPSGANPDIRTRLGAKKSENVLKSELKRMGFEYQLELGLYHMPLYGNIRWISGWDMPWDETVMVPQEAHACPRHVAFGNRYPPAPVPPLQQAAIILGIQAPPPPPQPCNYVQAGPLHPGTPDGQEMQHDTCPTCPDQPQLVPFQPTLEEANGVDSNGMPLGKAKPLGRGFVRTVTGYDTFVRDSGVDQSWEDVQEFVWTHVETLDWVAMRYPDKIRDEAGNLLIKPENPAKLSEHHPIAGMPMFYMAGSSMRLFDNHVRVKEYHRKPWMLWDEEKKQYAMNKGRSVIIAADVCLLDGDYLIPSQNNPEEYVERCILTMPPWEFRDGGRRTSGLGMWEGMFDPQDMINQSRSQTQAVIQTCAVPVMFATKGMNLESAENTVGLPGRQITYDADPVSPTARPELGNNMTIAPGVASEMASVYQFLQRFSGMVEVESGQVPGGVSAATAISYLLNESSERRKPRIRRIKEALRRIWTHQLKLIAALWIEARPYQYAGEDGEEAWGALHGLDLCGQTQAEVEVTSEEDTPEMKREKTRDLISLGVIKLGVDPNVDRLIAKELGAPETLYVDTDLQESAAQREWHYFSEQARIPQVDPTADDGQSHWMEHGRAWHTEEMRDLRDKANWDGALHFLSSDWDRQLDQLAIQSATPPMVAATPQQLASAPPIVRQMVATGQQPVPMVPGPPNPPLQDMIYAFWWQRLTKVGFLPQQGVPSQPGAQVCPDPQSLEKVCWWRAHMEAHRLQGEVKQAEAQASPTMGAPGTDQGQAAQAMQPGSAPPAPPQQQPVAA